MWIRDYKSDILKFLTDIRADKQEMEAFEEYEIALQAREELLDRYPGSEIFSAPKVDKELLNDYSTRIIMYETDLMATPIYEKLKKKYEEDQQNWPNFMKEGHGKVVQPTVEKAGWYQNSNGELFHYDGVVWDNVPSEQTKQLEYLG